MEKSLRIGVLLVRSPEKTCKRELIGQKNCSNFGQKLLLKKIFASNGSYKRFFFNHIYDLVLSKNSFNI
jgi:hypothetical protein